MLQLIHFSPYPISQFTTLPHLTTYQHQSQPQHHSLTPRTGKSHLLAAMNRNQHNYDNGDDGGERDKGDEITATSGCSVVCTQSSEPGRAAVNFWEGSHILILQLLLPTNHAPVYYPLITPTNHAPFALQWAEESSLACSGLTSSRTLVCWCTSWTAVMRHASANPTEPFTTF